MKCLCSLILIVCLNASAESSKDNCDRCIPIEDCSLFGQLSRDEQADITSKFSCTLHSENHVNKPFGFSSVAKGDYVCCPGTNVWGIEPSKPTSKAPLGGLNIHKEAPTPTDSTADEDSSNNDDDITYEKNNDNYFPQRRPYPDRNNFDSTPAAQLWNNPSYRIPQNQYGYDTTPRYNPNVPRLMGNNPSTYGNIPRQQSANQNPFVRDQCQNIGTMPPNPDSGCCGIQVIEENFGNAVPKNSPTQRNFWTPEPYNRPRWYRHIFKRDAVNTSNVTVGIDSRIAGGKETELEQFPWTVLLTITFVYGDKKKAFNCGGSLISARYVLTAAHCLSEQGAIVVSIQIALSEYDKRTTGLDCKRDSNGNKKCVQNIIVQAEDFVTHPQFDQNKLQNDIALVRLNQNAPYKVGGP